MAPAGPNLSETAMFLYAGTLVIALSKFPGSTRMLDLTRIFHAKIITCFESRESKERNSVYSELWSGQTNCARPDLYPSQDVRFHSNRSRIWLGLQTNLKA